MNLRLWAWINYADFNSIFVNENIYILSEITLKVVPLGSTDNDAAMNQVAIRKREAITWSFQF